MIKSRIFLQSILFASFALFCGVLQAHASYQYYRAITVTSTTSVASGTLTNFPLLVSSTVAAWAPSSTAGGTIQNLCAAPNGATEPCDLMFSTSTACAAPLNFETESYTSSTGAVVDWINVPSLSAGTSIYACYGDPSVKTDQSHPSSTWNSNYSGVWHFPSGSSPGVNDSTANGNNLTTVASPTSVAGEIDGGLGLNGSTQYATTTQSASLTFSNASFTVSAWFKTSSASNQAPFSTVNGGTTGVRLMILGATSGDLQMRASDGGTVGTPDVPLVQTASPVDNGAWHYAVFSVDRTANLATGYLDGASFGASSTVGAGAFSTSTAWLQVGASSNGGNSFFDGAIDEVRVLAGTALSSQWVLTSYSNQSNPSSFYSLGSSVAAFSASPAIVASAGTSTLSWSLTNASSVAITPGSFSTSAEIGSTTVNPTSTTVYTLTATASGGATSTYTAAVTVDATPPTVPGTPTVTALGTSTVSLSWSASTDSGGAGLAGYQVFRCAGSCTPSVRIGTSTLTSYADATASPNTPYTYSVTAYDGVGNVSGQSGATTVTTLPISSITFDTSSSASGNVTSTFATITIGSGSNEALVVAVNSSNGSTNCQSPAVTVNGVTPTLAVAATTTNLRFESIYYLTGQSGTLSVTSTCPVATQQGMFLSSWFGVNQSNPVDATSSNATSSVLGTAVSDSITVANSGDMLVDGASARNAFVSAGLGQTVIGTSSIVAVNYGASSYIPVPAAGTYTMSWTISPAQSWQQGIVALRAYVARAVDSLFFSSD